MTARQLTNRNITRRSLLRSCLAAGTAIAAGTLAPKTVIASWNEAAFSAKDVSGALQESMGSADASDSADVVIDVPDTPENAATVPVKISTSLADVSSIAVLVDKNPRILSGVFHFNKLTKPKLTVRIKVAESANIIAAVKAGGKLYTTRKAVKIAIGGC